MAEGMSRSLEFSARPGRRYWWHAGEGAPRYVPPIYSFLSDQEWEIIRAWFDETDRRDMIGECQVPLLSLLQGLIMGNQVGAIVQAGHYAGYSTLMLGFMLRRMGMGRSLFTIDVHGPSCEFTRGWVERAGLEEQVCIHEGDSADPAAAGLAERYLGESPRLVFIDSSHAYAHTCEELELWYPRLAEGGFLVCHDSSPRATAFDSTGQGGVRRALTEWRARHPEVSAMAFAGAPGENSRAGVYQDLCGVFVAQRPVDGAQGAGVL